MPPEDWAEAPENPNANMISIAATAVVPRIPRKRMKFLLFTVTTRVIAE